jgi:hypothetical protein
MQSQRITAGNTAHFAENRCNSFFVRIFYRALILGVVEEFHYFVGIVPHGGWLEVEDIFCN